MTICCFPNCAYLSETSRMIAVYRRLVAMGEPVVMATHGGTYEFVLRDEGIPFHHVPPHMSDERAQEYVATNRAERGLHGFYQTDELRQHVQSEMAFFRENEVKVVLTGWTLSNALSTRAAGIPYAVTHLGSWVPPIFERGMQPWAVLWDNVITRSIPDRWGTKLINWRIPRFKFFTKSENVIAREIGITSFKSFLDLVLGDLTLVTDVPEILGIPRDEMDAWTPSDPKLYGGEPRLRYVGAIFARLFGDVPDDVAAFLDTEKPKVYVALTSSRPEYVTSVHAVLRNMDVRAVLCTTIHPTSLPDTPNILVKDHLPSHGVMPLVDLVIIHGGQGSVQTAIAAGVPLIGFQLQGEQSFNLAMIERHGAGLALPLRSLKRGHLRTDIERVLNEPSFTTSMRRLKELQDRYDGAENAAIALQELAQEACKCREHSSQVRF